MSSRGMGLRVDLSLEDIEEIQGHYSDTFAARWSLR
jgi:hypothetical protein